MKKSHFIILLLLLTVLQLKGQKNTPLPSPWKHALSINPFPCLARQVNISYDYRLKASEAIGVEVIYGFGYYGPYNSRRQITRLELNQSSRAIRTRLRYKHYAFSKDERKGIASMYVSPQIGFKRIKGLTYLEGQRELGVLELTRTGLRFDMIFGADMKFGRFLIGYYAGAGMGHLLEHRATTETGKSLGLFPEQEWIFDVGPRGGINIGICF